MTDDEQLADLREHWAPEPGRHGYLIEFDGIHWWAMATNDDGLLMSGADVLDGDTADDLREAIRSDSAKRGLTP